MDFDKKIYGIRKRLTKFGRFPHKIISRYSITKIDVE